MLAKLESNFNRIYKILAALIFVFVCIRAILVPLSHEEVAGFFFYIQSDSWLPYSSHESTGNYYLNSFLANLFYHLFGSHPFVLRLPAVLSFIALAAGVYKHFRFLKQLSSKLILTACFLLNIFFLDYFGVSAGFGISMGLLVLGLSYLTKYFYDKDQKDVVFFSLYTQLALAANLMLVIPTAILLCYLYVRQYRIRTLFTAKNLLLQAINLGALAFWAMLLIDYKQKGLFGPATSNEFWNNTFSSLIYTFTGSREIIVQVIVLLIAAPVIIYFFWNILKNSFWFNDLFTPLLSYPFMFVLLVAGVYTQKKILGLNYPEDRSAMAFFPLFVLSLVFAVDVLPKKISETIGILFSAGMLVLFVTMFHLKSYTIWFYQTIPADVYKTLAAEIEKQSEVKTIGGNPIRELNFAFLNYTNDGKLNPMDNSQEMQMYCDYYIASGDEKEFYAPYYEEMMKDERWGRVLLKRKEKITRELVSEIREQKNFSGNKEFFDLVLLNDTSFGKNPLEVEVELNFEKVPVPFNAFFALSVENEQGQNVCYKRIPLNWLAKDLNGKSRKLKLLSSSLPAKIKKFVIHVWNIDKKEVRFSLKNLKISRLQGKGVDVKIPASYYKQVELITKKPLL